MRIVYKIIATILAMVITVGNIPASIMAETAYNSEPDVSQVNTGSLDSYSLSDISDESVGIDTYERIGKSNATRMQEWASVEAKAQDSTHISSAATIVHEGTYNQYSSYTACKWTLDSEGTFTIGNSGSVCTLGTVVPDDLKNYVLDVKKITTTGTVEIRGQISNCIKGMTNVTSVDFSNHINSNKSVRLYGSASATFAFSDFANLEEVSFYGVDFTHDNASYSGFWAGAFSGCHKIKYVDFRNVKVGSGTFGENSQGGFAKQSNLGLTNTDAPLTVDVRGWDLSSAVSLGRMFEGCVALRHIDGLIDGYNDGETPYYGDFSWKNANSLRSVYNMFTGCYNLEELVISPALTGLNDRFHAYVTGLSDWESFKDYWNSSWKGVGRNWESGKSGPNYILGVPANFQGFVTYTGAKYIYIAGLDLTKSDFRPQFYNNNLTELDLPYWRIDGGDGYGMFGQGWTVNTNVIRLPYWDATEATSLMTMFAGGNYTEIEGFDTWRVSDKLEHAESMFSGSSITNVTFPAGFNPIYASSMFSGCTRLNNVEINDGFSQTTSMHSMFSRCTSLHTVSFPSGFGRSVETTASMFASDTNLISVYLPDEFGANITDHSNMFAGTGLVYLELPDSFEFLGDNIALPAGKWDLDSIREKKYTEKTIATVNPQLNTPGLYSRSFSGAQGCPWKVELFNGKSVLEVGEDGKECTLTSYPYITSTTPWSSYNDLISEIYTRGKILSPANNTQYPFYKLTNVSFADFSALDFSAYTFSDLATPSHSDETPYPREYILPSTVKLTSISGVWHKDGENVYYSNNEMLSQQPQKTNPGKYIEEHGGVSTSYINDGMPGCLWRIDDSWQLTVGRNGEQCVINGNPWASYSNEIQSVRFEGEDFDKSSSRPFSGLSSATNIDFTNLNTSMVSTLNSYLANDSKLETLVLSEGMTHSGITSATNMFQSDSALRSVTLPSDWDFLNTKLPDPPTNDTYTGKWTYEFPTNSADAMTASELASKFNGETMAGTWVWERKKTSDLMKQYNSDWSKWENYADEEGTWHRISDSTWQYIFNVYDTGDDLPYYVWEDEVAGYNSNATISNPIVTTTGEATIVNESQTVKPVSFGRLIISKTVSDNSDASFVFKINLRDENDKAIKGTKVYSDIAFINGEGTVTLAKGESLTLVLPDGYHYEITENEAAGYTSTVSSGSATGVIDVMADQSVTFNNVADEVPVAGQMVLFKRVQGNVTDPNATYDFYVSFMGLKGLATYTIGGAGNGATFTADANGNATASLSLHNGENAVFSAMPVGSTFQVTEQAGNYVSSYTVSGINVLKPMDANTSENRGLSTATEKISGMMMVTFTNTVIAKSDLVLEKVVPDAEDSDNTKFEFTIHFTEMEPGASYSSDIGRITADDNGEVEKTFYLSNGETVTFEDLPVGVNYEITESPSAYIAKFSVDGSTSGNNSAPNRSLSTGLQSILDQDENHVTFTNEVVRSSLTVAKVVESALASDKNADYAFTLTLKNGADNSETIAAPIHGEFPYTITESGKTPINGTIEFGSTGIANITLKHGQSMKISKLPVGARYTVEEEDYSEDGFTTTVTGDDNGFILENDRSVVTFTNSVTRTSAISLEKKVTGNLGSRDKDFTFEITMENSSADVDGTYTYSGTQGGVSVSNKTLTIQGGKGTITLRHGDKVVFDAIIGTKVTVKEADYSADGYTTTYSNNGMIVDADSTKNNIVTTNRNGTTIPTGIVISSGGFLTMLLGLAGLVAVTRKPK